MADAYMLKWVHKDNKYQTLFQYRMDAEAYIDDNEIKNADIVPLFGAKKLWLWKNFVDGRPEYWAFDNPYPVHPNGDPMTLGEPVGFAIPKECDGNARPEKTDGEVIAAILRSRSAASTS